jgi:hypothetical protein
MKAHFHLAAVLSLLALLSLSAGAQQDGPPYAVKPLPPGGPAPRLANGNPDFSGHWLPNGAGQGVSGRFGVDPAARGQFDPKVTPELPPAFQPWAAAKIKSMTEVERELARSSVNCMPRGLPAIWLQNPYSTVIVHTRAMMAQLFEVLNNWRLIHLDGRPVPMDPEPWFHGTPNPRWDGDTLVIETTGIDEQTYVMPNGWFHSAEMKVTERYSRPSMNYLFVEITVEDPKVLERPWKSAPRRWTLGNGEVYEFYCTNNREVEELEKLRQQELQAK